MRLPGVDWLLIAGAAVVTTLAYPPFALVVPAFICLVPAAFLILRGNADPHPRARHLRQGFWYGAVTHGALLYWFGWALWGYGRGMVVLYPIAVVALGALTAIMFVLVGRAVSRSPGRLVVALPAGVVLFEWLLAQLGPLGLPWHRLALTVATQPVLVQAADVAGSGGLAFALAAVNVSLALAWTTRRRRATAFAHMEIAGSLVLVLVVYGLHRLGTLPLEPGPTVAVIQPNIGASEKWGPRGKDQVVERTVRLAEVAIGNAGPALVVFPETALPDAVASHPSWDTRLTQLARRSGSDLLTGGVEIAMAANSAPIRYNAAFTFSATGGGAPLVVHRKQKLIPMIERVPSGSLDLSATGFGGFSPGGELEVADSPVGRFGTLVCYELIFEEMARSLRNAGARVLVTISNDAWFGRTSAPHQHFAHAVLRAVENRVTVVRAGNTGISGIVDPLGRVVTRTQPFVETYAAAKVVRTPSDPLAVRIGGMAGPFAGVLLLLLAVAGRASGIDQARRSQAGPLNREA